MRIVGIFFLLVLIGCGRGPSGPKPLDRQQFVALYADLEATLWSATRTTADTVALAHVADSVLAAHAINRDQYLETLRWYNEDATRWKGFFDEVGKILEDRSKAEWGQRTAASTKTQGDQATGRDAETSP